MSPSAQPFTHQRYSTIDYRFARCKAINVKNNQLEHQPTRFVNAAVVLMAAIPLSEIESLGDMCDDVLELAGEMENQHPGGNFARRSLREVQGGRTEETPQCVITSVT